MAQNNFTTQSILIIDDEASVCESIRGVLESRNLGPVFACTDSRMASAVINKRLPTLILLDLTMPHITGMEILEESRSNHPEIPIIVITGVNEIETAMDCIHLGARDYLVKAIDNLKLLAAVGRVLEIEALKDAADTVKRHLLSDTLERSEEFAAIITQSRKMNTLFLYLEAVAPSVQPVLIRGETGTGKEEVAAIIHRISERNGEFVNVNVAGLDDTMFADTLFGHRKGAYTGADENRRGLIAQTGSGTLFLDEIGELNQPSQVKLLRLLESGEYYPLGSDVVRRSECRIVAATNKDLEKMMEEGSFRKDLYYRLKFHEVVIPPLHERKEDIPILADHFMLMACGEMGKEKLKISLSAYKQLSQSDYPGNIRELKGLIYDAVSVSRLGYLAISGIEIPETGASASGGILGFPRVLPTLKEASDQLIEEALNRSMGNITAAASDLGITQSALSQRLSRVKKGRPENEPPEN